VCIIIGIMLYEHGLTKEELFRIQAKKALYRENVREARVHVQVYKRLPDNVHDFHRNDVRWMINYLRKIVHRMTPEDKLFCKYFEYMWLKPVSGRTYTIDWVTYGFVQRFSKYVNWKLSEYKPVFFASTPQRVYKDYEVYKENI